MFDIVYHVLFICITLFILLKTIFYGLYEFKTENNKFGGIGVIVFSSLATIFAYIVVF